MSLEIFIAASLLASFVIWIGVYFELKKIGGFSRSFEIKETVGILLLSLIPCFNFVVIIVFMAQKISDFEFNDDIIEKINKILFGESK